MPNDIPPTVTNPVPVVPDSTQGMFSAAQLQAPLDNIPAPAAPIKYTPTADELASAKPVDSTAPIKYTPTADELASAKPAPGPSIFEAMTPEQMVAEARANPKDFDPIQAFQSLPASKQFELFDKAAETYHQLRQSGHYVPSFMDMLKNAGKSIKDLVVSNAELAANVGVGSLVKTALSPFRDTSDPATFAGALNKQTQQASGEFLAGQKVAALGLGQMLVKGAQWTARGLHITRALPDYTPQDKTDALVTELATRNGMARAVREGIAPERAAELAKEGYGLRPEKVEQAASGSPYAWEAAGKLFGGATKMTAEAAAPFLATLAGDTSAEGLAAAQRAVHALPAIASDLSARAVGRTIQGAARVGEKVAEKAEAAAPAIGKVGGAVGGVVAGHHLAGPAGIALGIAEGFKRGGEFGESAATGLGKAAVTMDKLAEMGKQVATGEGMSSSTGQLVRDLAQAAPGAAARIGAGAAMDVGLGAATTETPGERAGFTPFGTILGAAGALGSAGRRTLSGQIIAPRAWGSEGAPIRPENFSLNFPSLDAAHNDAIANAAPGVQQRYNAVQKFLDGAAPGTQLVYAPRPEAGHEDTLPQVLQASGIDPAYADQDGFITKVQGQDGQPHQIAIVRNMEAAPHEARHAMDDVIGATAVEKLNDAAKQQYAEHWDAFKQHYADRLTPTGLPTSDPNGTILRESRWGDAAAKEKIYAQTRDALVQEGQNPTDAQVREAAGNAIRAEQGRAQQAGQDLWETTLTPEEQAHVADQYVGSEVRAEHHDAWFKAGQPGTMRGKMATAAGSVLSALGVNPLEGRSSTYGTPLEGSLVTQAGKSAPKVEMPAEAPAAEGTPAAHQQAVQNAQKAAANASNQAIPGAVKTQKEVLGVVAEAIARKQGVKLTGLFAPDEPAASLTSDRETRRAMIEAYRTMPDIAKKMWGKLFFPENVPVTARGGNLQIFGWAPEVFAANAQKVAGSLNALADKGTNLSPYELDPATGSFTEQGWKDLYDDVQKFVGNQMGGRTGAGNQLVVPEAVARAGAAAPPVRGETSPLSQDRADFISALFHAKLPDTGLARQGAIDMPLNRAGQLVSAATLPGRVEPPVTPRGTFRGAVAARQGVKGEPIMEVNPFRNRFESALQQAGVEKPSLIEVNQRLNLKNIKDVELAPEQGQFRANTLTLQAGFQPKKLGEDLDLMGRAALKMPNGELVTAPGVFHPTLRKMAADKGYSPADVESAVEGYSNQAADRFISKDQVKQNYYEQQRRERASFQPAGKAGASEKEVAAAQKEWTDKGTESKYFKRWFGDSKIVGDADTQVIGQTKIGEPRIVYHGTTHDFDTFGSERGNVENHAGSGHYFTSEEFDAEHNYHETGPDLWAKIERRADQIRDAQEPYMDWDEAMAQAKQEISGGNPKTISAYLKMENPVVLKEKGGTRFPIEIDDNGNESGAGLDLYHSVLSESDALGIDGQKLWNEITSEAGDAFLDDGMTAHELRRFIAHSELTYDSNDPQGRAMGSELFKRVMQDMGFDGVIQESPATDFPGMNIPRDAKHFIVWQPEQVKGVDNRGTFDPKDARYNFQPKSPKDFLDFLDKSNPEDYAKRVKEFTSGKYGGGQTGMSFDIGSKVSTPEELAALRSAAARFAELGRAALKEKDFSTAMHFTSKSQAAREAYEAAADEGGSGDFIRSHFDPKYKGPMAKGAATDESVNFQPSSIFKPRRSSTDLLDEIYSNGYKKLWPANADYWNIFRHPTTGQNIEMVRNEDNLWHAQPIADASAQSVNPVQFMHSLEGIKRMNDEEVARQQRGRTETETTRASSYAGDAETGLVLHSAKQRSTVFLKPGPQAEDFQKKWNGAKTQASRNHLVESYFSQTARFQPMQAHTSEEDIKTARQFWVTNKGVTHPAFGGHQSEAEESILPEDFASKLPAALRLSEDSKADAVYSAMRSSGHVRGLYRKFPDHLDFTGQPFNQLSSAAQKEILRLSSKMNLPAQYNGRTLDTGIEGEGPTHFQPKELSSSANPEGEKLVVDRIPDLVHNKGSFMAKQKTNKTDEKWELKPGGAQFTKAWILPNGKLEQFGGTWHHDWLNEQTALRKKYNIPSVGVAEDADESRIPAMKAGFARVNYDKYNGKLTVEARKADWPNVLPSVQELVKNNLGKFDSIQVYRFNDKVSKVADADGAQLFNIPREERVQNIPFTSKEGAVSVAQVGEAGEEGSQQLFNKAAGNAFGKGSFQPAVKLPSPKPEEFAHNDTIEAALAKPNWAILTGTQEALGPHDNEANTKNNERLYSELVSNGHTPIEVKGSYQGVDQGRNFLVTGISPKDALDWGRRFKQDSVVTPNGLLYADGSVQPPDATQNKIGPDAEKEPFFSRVENGPAFSMGFDEKVKPTAEEMVLGDLGTKKPLSTKQVGDMTKAQIAAHYPESVIPRAKDDAIESNIVGSPLAKEAGSRAAAVKAFAKKLVDFAKQNEKSNGYQSGLKWYSEFVPQLKKVYGKHAQIMAELLAATSPNNAPDTNFAFANDALEGYISGRFQKQIAKFSEGLVKIADGSWEPWLNRELKAGKVRNAPETPSAATFLDHWIAKHNLNPRQSNGQLYSMHSVPVLRVFAREWLAQTKGPKTQNFVQNLLGTGHDATIDVWADRTMRRLGYADHQARWRILPKNATGVSDADFDFSQEAFRDAAKELGVKPDALQGGLWFAEKQLWSDNGWGRLDLGDYRKEIAKADLLKSGITQRLAVQKAKAKVQPLEQPELLVTPR